MGELIDWKSVKETDVVAHIKIPVAFETCPFTNGDYRNTERGESFATLNAVSGNELAQVSSVAEVDID
ncbi:hypothetical protein QN219_32625 [Sinorhizobium sp. 7-81]|uniref:hypothetical protein n=1 Tax=Sinorhizobium sp. 8-89 TaxID=3049089 RepID=UPI0024C43C2F|nr:hypothetical protein [Sinorhizobium sp. 8-89]MDK1494662.1 hypothetical protein [Sinorhizobium sp. 8-89]